MPSITYIEDNGSDKERDSSGQTAQRKAPEPPARYDGGSVPPLKPEGPAAVSEAGEFASVRRLVTIAQVMAIVSLLIGGVVLSTASLVVALAASSKVRKRLQAQQPDQLPWQMLKRSTTIAIAVAVLALAANIVALVMIYPMVMQALQSGEYASLLNGAAQAPSSTGTSTWG